MFAPRSGRWLFGGGALLAGLGAAVVAGWLRGPYVLILLGALAALWAFLAWFYRDPERSAGPEIVSPADGRIAFVTEEAGQLRIAVFMNVTDVHVNRFPMNASVEAVEEAGHGFAPAYRASARGNVQRRYRLATAFGTVFVIQITGILARRLVSFVHAGEAHRKGERLGMIVLGSRVDLLVPADRLTAVVRPGDRVVAGVTPIARERR